MLVGVPDICISFGRANGISHAGRLPLKARHSNCAHHTFTPVTSPVSAEANVYFFPSASPSRECFPLERLFERRTSTPIVDAHGALIQLRGVVSQGERLTLKHLKTEESTVCKVVDSNPGVDGVQEIGVEFLQPNPKFWRVSFPPADWSPRSLEAKSVTKHPSVGPRPVKLPSNTK